MDDRKLIAAAQALDDMLVTLNQAKERRDTAAADLARAQSDVVAAQSNVEALRTRIIGATA